MRSRRYDNGPWVSHSIPVLSIAAIAVILALHAASKDGSRRPDHDNHTVESRIRAIGDEATVGGRERDGRAIVVDLPSNLHVKNFGAPADGKGLCVFASMTMAARWHNISQLMDIIHKLDSGGGWPEKVDRVIQKYAPEIKYVQYEGADPSMMDRAIAEDRAVCCTYGYGERYQMATISHMVMLVYLDAQQAVILDNNFPGTYEWMSRQEFLKRWVHPSGKGWAYVLLADPPPPVPHN